MTDADVLLRLTVLVTSQRQASASADGPSLYRCGRVDGLNFVLGLLSEAKRESETLASQKLQALTQNTEELAALITQSEK